MYSYVPQNEDELELKEGDLVSVMEKCDDGWFVGTCVKSQRFLRGAVTLAVTSIHIGFLQNDSKGLNACGVHAQGS